MFTKTFTDPQGVTHTDAVFETAISYYSENASEDYTFQISNGDAETSKTSNTHEGNNLRYRIYYWASQEARDAGLLPYVLANSDPIGEWFEVQNLDNSYTNLTAALKAERHCETVTLA